MTRPECGLRLVEAQKVIGPDCLLLVGLEGTFDECVAVGTPVGGPTEGDPEIVGHLLEVVLAVDTLERRIELARAVIELRDQGRIAPKLDAVAVLGLDRKESTSFHSSIAESIVVLAGEQQIPAGLVVFVR
jgi:hypothetical protein